MGVKECPEQISMGSEWLCSIEFDGAAHPFGERRRFPIRIKLRDEAGVRRGVGRDDGAVGGELRLCCRDRFEDGSEDFVYVYKLAWEIDEVCAGRCFQSATHESVSNVLDVIVAHASSVADG